MNMDINACTIDSIPLSDSIKTLIWRWDKIHPTISGNKYFKLVGHAQEMHQQGVRSILTFGGAYSNHLHAVAHFSFLKNYKCICIIRADEMLENDTIRDLRALNVDLHFVSREDYKRKLDSHKIQEIIQSYSDVYIIPEGGEGKAGEKGFELLKDLIPSDLTHVCISVGTGTTLKGLRKIFPQNIKMIGFTSFKNMSLQFTEKWLKENNTELLDCSEMGKFGKWKPELIDFMNNFYQKHSIPLDIVYTSKMCFKIQKLLDTNYFTEKDTILLIHTGGLQGNRSIQNNLIF